MTERMKTPEYLYDQNAPQSNFSAKRDDQYFSENPKSVCRVRKLIEGESPISDEIVGDGSTYRSYAIVIHHKRNNDKRKSAYIGVYPAIIKDMGSGKNKDFILREAERYLKWFKKSDQTPPPLNGNAVVC